MQLASALWADRRPGGPCGCRIPVNPGPPEEGVRAHLLLPCCSVQSWRRRTVVLFLAGLVSGRRLV